ncbi:PQQ-binding-like beta-propeller repeat protein [Streptomyces sp. NPDC091259]|uniref:serine/threonine-protein kinase n=1 Tax=Streptomyces sp. NPDC091259 TaxID=3365976 RepID=UPI0038279002
MHARRADYAGFPEYAGHYRLESVLGSGGMGVVHLATSSSGLKLAVKVVHAQHAVDPEFRARFRQEVAAARRVSGAFTAPVVDADPDAERPWMATLFIDAPTLSERVRERVLDAAELTRLAAGLAEALRDIHRAGVVHRDLKPSNVLMAPDGVRVIDFGISRPADSDLRTETGKLIGTPPFMAPEQFQRPREVGTAADLFALGAVLVHAATGRGPFDSDSHYLVAYQVVHGEPDLTGLPGPLVPLVARCLAKDPAERPTADALIARMRELAYPTGEDTQTFTPQPRRAVGVVAAGGVGARGADVDTHRRERLDPPPAPDGSGPGGAGAGRPARRRVRTAWAAGLVVLLAGGAVGGYLGSATGEESPASPAAKKAQAGPTKGFAPWSVALGGSDAGKRIGACSWGAVALYCAGQGLAAARLDPANGSLGWTVPARAVPGPVSARAPLYAGGLVLTVGAGGDVLQALDPATGARRWQRNLPGGAQVVAETGHVLTAASDGDVTLLDAATGAPKWSRRIGGTGSVWWAGPDASGRPALYVATREPDGSRTQVAAVDPGDGTVRWQLRTAGLLQPVATVQGGAYLLANDAQGKTDAVVRVDLTTRAVRRVTLAVPLYEAQATAGPDGVVYLVGSSGGLAAVGPERERWRLETGLAVASRPAVADGRVYLTAPDGRLLAVGASDGRLTGQTRPRMGAGPGAFAASLPAPVVADGVVYASAPDGSVFAVDAANPAGW